jgi:hypothetical protein
MIQEIVIGIIFILALVYIGRMIFKSFQTKSAGCATGCGKCGVAEEQVSKLTN